MARTSNLPAPAAADAPARRGRGRPPGFDRARALQQAMLLFWDRGYEGTSFDALIAAMGISPSSFYNSFTSKERLYQEVIEAFVDGFGRDFLQDLENGPDTRAAFARLFDRLAHGFTSPDHPPGCMISLAATHGPPVLDGLHAMMARHRLAGQTAMAERIRRGIADGDLPADTDATALAGYFNALARGMAVAARDGAGLAQLQQIAALGLRAFPPSPEPGNRPPEK